MDYRYIANSYDGLHKEEQLKKLNIIASYLEKNKISLKDKKILDIGSGTGISTIFFSKDAIGLEPEIKMIKQANYKAVLGEAEFLPFKSRTFDAVVSLTAFHNFKNQERAIKEIKRVLKPKYLLIITLLKRSKDYSRLKSLIKANFKVVEIDEEKDSILISNNLS